MACGASDERLGMLDGFGPLGGREFMSLLLVARFARQTKCMGKEIGSWPATYRPQELEEGSRL